MRGWPGSDSQIPSDEWEPVSAAAPEPGTRRPSSPMLGPMARAVASSGVRPGNMAGHFLMGREEQGFALVGWCLEGATGHPQDFLVGVLIQGGSKAWSLMPLPTAGRTDPRLCPSLSLDTSPWACPTQGSGGPFLTRDAPAGTGPWRWPPQGDPCCQAGASILKASPRVTAVPQSQ